MEKPVKVIVYIRGGMCIDVVTNLSEDSWDYTIMDFDNHPDLPDDHIQTVSVSAERVHAGRTVSGDCYHRYSGCAAVARNPGGTRGGAAVAVLEPPETDWGRVPELSRYSSQFPVLRG